MPTEISVIKYIKMASNTFLSRLTPHVEEIIRNHQCWSDHKGSKIIKRTASIRWWEYNETAYWLFNDFNKVHDAVVNYHVVSTPYWGSSWRVWRLKKEEKKWLALWNMQITLCYQLRKKQWVLQGMLG